jgi:rhizosphere induced protein
MSTTYTVDFNNETTQGKVVQFAIYQVYPEHPGLETIAWKKSGVYDGGSSEIKWVVSYYAMISDYKDDEGKGVFKSSQQALAGLKDRFQVTDKDVRKETILKIKFYLSLLVDEYLL